MQLAQPDFSMPYNVACMTCTVLAVFLAALMNALFRCALCCASAAGPARTVTAGYTGTTLLGCAES